MELSEVLSFYKNKRVLVTGHTGFKGTWLCRILAGAGAEVTGFALRPKEPSLFAMAGLGAHRFRVWRYPGFRASAKGIPAGRTRNCIPFGSPASCKGILPKSCWYIWGKCDGSSACL